MLMISRGNLVSTKKSNDCICRKNVIISKTVGSNQWCIYAKWCPWQNLHVRPYE